MPGGAPKNPLAIWACLAALVLLFLAALPADAGARVVISGGETRLALDPGLIRDLRREGVKTTGVEPGTANGRVVELPVVAGATNGDPGRGALTVAGGFSFRGGGRVARFAELLLNTGKGQSTAKIAGERRILARHGALQSSPDGFGTRIRIRHLRLTGGTAAALNRRLGLNEVFRRGRRLGSLTIVAIPATVPIAFGSIAIGGRETTFSKLESLKAQIGLWGGAEGWGREIGDPFYVFQTAPTELPPDASAGTLEAGPDDGITVQVWDESSPLRGNMLLQGPRIDLAARELSAHLGPLPPEGGPIPMETFNPLPIATLDYSAATFQIRPRVGAFELMGIRAVANQSLADQLNARFQTPGLFQAGETFARVTLTLHDR